MRLLRKLIAGAVLLALAHLAPARPAVADLFTSTFWQGTVQRFDRSATASGVTS